MNGEAPNLHRDQLYGRQRGQSEDSKIWNISGQERTVDSETKTSGEQDEEELPDYKFGWCGWKPNWLQKVNRPVWLLVFLCCYSFMQGLIINGFINVVISTLERRFDLPSKKTGLIASTYDIATATLVIFVSYYGGTGHKVRWVAFGCVIMAVGSVVFGLPHFTTGLHTNTSGSLVCDTAEDCQGASSLANYFYVFILSQALHGVGCTPLYSIGVTMLDESVTVHQSALYLGIFYAISSLGPGVGYIVGGAFLNIYTDVGEVDVSSLGLTPNDPGWVGAWWIGFICGGIIAFFVSLPLFGFPREFPTTQQIRSEKVSQVHLSNDVEEVSNPNFGEKLSDFPRAVKYLMLNPTFVFLVLVGCCEGLTVSGIATFGPKVIETQFLKTSGTASLLMGLCAIPGAGFGTFLGGYLTKRWQLKVGGMIKFCCVTSTVTMVALFGMFVRCPQEYLVGVNVDYNGNITVADDMLVNDCNKDCGCTRTEFNPVCGDNGMEYFDPCFAGCTASSEDAKHFSDCSCLALSGTNTSSTASAGKCTKDCGYLPLFLIALVLLMVFHFLAASPGISSILRCVPESQRSLAVGIQWIFIRILGTIPGPIVFGAALDSSCILWQEDCRGQQGSCFLYSGKSISWKFFLLSFGLATLTLIFFLLALWTYKGPQDDKEMGKEAKIIEVSKENAINDKDSYRPDINRMISSSSQLAIIANESLPPEYEDTTNDMDQYAYDNVMISWV